MKSVSSVSQSWLCYPVECSSPGFPVHHQLLELAQTHVGDDELSDTFMSIYASSWHTAHIQLFPLPYFTQQMFTDDLVWANIIIGAGR